MSEALAVRPWTTADRPDWDAFVAGHPGAGTGHLSALIRLGETLPGVETCSLLARGPHGEVAGVLPLFLATSRRLRVVPVRSALSGVLLPAGPLADHRLPPERQQAVIEALLEQARQLAGARRADRLVVALPGLTGGRPVLGGAGTSPLLGYGFHDDLRAGTYLDLQRPASELWQGLDPKCRNMIRRAEREGATAAVVSERSDWLAAAEISAASEPANRYPGAFFEAAWTELIEPGHAVPVGVWAGGMLRSLSLGSLQNGSAYYWFNFSRRPVSPPGVNNLALWRLIEECRNRGALGFELGSLDSGPGRQGSIARFKESFGGVPYYAVAGERVLRPLREAALDLAEQCVASLRAWARE